MDRPHLRPSAKDLIRYGAFALTAALTACTFPGLSVTRELRGCILSTDTATSRLGDQLVINVNVDGEGTKKVIAPDDQIEKVKNNFPRASRIAIRITIQDLTLGATGYTSRMNSLNKRADKIVSSKQYVLSNSEKSPDSVELEMIEPYSQKCTG